MGNASVSLCVVAFSFPAPLQTHLYFFSPAPLFRLAAPLAPVKDFTPYFAAASDGSDQRQRRGAPTG